MTTPVYCPRCFKNDAVVEQEPKGQRFRWFECQNPNCRYVWCLVVTEVQSAATTQNELVAPVK